MDNPTICAKCKHVRPHGQEGSADYFGLAYCDAAYVVMPDYVAGGTKRRVRNNDFQTCSVRNKGECPDYEAKETTDAE